MWQDKGPNTALPLMGYSNTDRNINPNPNHNPNSNPKFPDTSRSMPPECPDICSAAQPEELHNFPVDKLRQIHTSELLTVILRHLKNIHNANQYLSTAGHKI